MAEPPPGGSGPDELARYQLAGVLGRGAMGEVVLAHDTRVDRDVAIKRMQYAGDDAAARFFREAWIQGRLEHPAVVPIHDLGVDGKGDPYFVMKRVSGTTLDAVLGGDAREPGAFPRRILLTKFVEVCLAIEFAHQRGVIHRDLKPANLMLGDFGEVYVLDWGIAKLDEGPVMTRPPDDVTVDAAQTVTGALMGTPGYMSPEQVRGETVDRSSDVYSLGCILFEILTGHPAIERGEHILERTLSADAHRPSAAWPDAGVPPELDDACAMATDQASERRPSARGLAAAVQAYLDGDRDHARRHDLAEHHAVAAQLALEAGTGDEARAMAMQEAGRALALDLNNRIAQQVLGHLLLQNPERVPAEALDATEAERARIRQGAIRWSASSTFGLAIATAVVGTVLPVSHVFLVGALCVATVAFSVALYLGSRRARPISTSAFVGALVYNGVLLGLACTIFGPFSFAGLFVLASLAKFLAQPSPCRPALISATHGGAIGVPLALEWLGVLPPTYSFDGHALVLHPWVVDFTPTATVAIMTIAVVYTVVSLTNLLVTQRRAGEAAQERLHVQAWHLSKLLPRGGVRSS